MTKLSYFLLIVKTLHPIRKVSIYRYKVEKFKDKVGVIVKVTKKMVKVDIVGLGEKYDWQKWTSIFVVFVLIINILSMLYGAQYILPSE